MKYESIAAGMVLKLKRSRATDYGMIQDTVTVLGKKDRPGYQVGLIFASYLVKDSYGTRMSSGYFKPSDFDHRVWVINFGKSQRRFYTPYHAEQFADALRLNGTPYTVGRRPMTLAEHDARCDALWRKLDTLRDAGQGGPTASPEYLETLKALQTATKERLEGFSWNTLAR